MAFMEEYPNTSITVVVDEFSNVAYPLFVDAVNKGGGAQARFILALQSLADPEAKPLEELL